MPVRNGHTSAEIKPPGGKLLRCTLTLEAGVIVDARFTGDFFMMPEEAIQRLEQLIKGSSIEIASIRRIIMAFFTHDIEVIGVTPDHFVQVVAEAIGAR